MRLTLCLLRLVVRTTGFHPVNAGSTPTGDAYFLSKERIFLLTMVYFFQLCPLKGYSIWNYGEAYEGKVALVVCMSESESFIHEMTAEPWKCKLVTKRVPKKSLGEYQFACLTRVFSRRFYAAVLSFKKSARLF